VFSWERHVNAYDALYSQLIKQGKVKNRLRREDTGLPHDDQTKRCRENGDGQLGSNCHEDGMPELMKTAVGQAAMVSPVNNFVVTGPARVGTHMFLTALKQHSEIHCLGEIFLPIDFVQRYIPESKTTMRDILDSLLSASDKHIFGFAVHYNEMFQSRYTQGLIGELIERKFAVIHLTRDNLLRRFLSYKLARMTETWGDTDGNKPSTAKVALHCAEIVLDIRRTVKRAAKVRTLFGHLPYMEVSYEGMCADFSGTLKGVCEFLGASYQDLRPRTFKQENRSLREAIVNYDRLKWLFRLSKYRRFFDE